MANNAVGQERQRDHIIQKANILSFQGPIPLFALNSATILVTNHWNRHRFSRIFWNNHEISTSHCFPPWNVPSPSPMLSHAYFEALRPLWYPNQHWGRGNRHKCFKIFDEYCRCLLYHVAVFCKGPIVHTFLGKRINFSFLLDIIKILKGCMDEMRTIDSSGDVNYFFISKVIRH